MGERAHVIKAEQPRNLGYMQLAVTEVTNRQIAPQLLNISVTFVIAARRTRLEMHEQLG